MVFDRSIHTERNALLILSVCYKKFIFKIAAAYDSQQSLKFVAQISIKKKMCVAAHRHLGPGFYFILSNVYI